MPIKPDLPRLGKVLLEAQLVSEAQLTNAIHNARRAKQSLLAYLLQSLPLSANIISQACARHFGLPHRELHGFSSENLPLTLIHEKIIQRHSVLPLIQTEQQLLVAVSDPDDFPWLEDIQYYTGLIPQAVMAPYDQLTHLINRVLAEKNYLDVVHAQTPAVAFVEQILTDALHRNASDIHCEPTADQYRVRMRIDGLLYEIAQAPAYLANAIISRLKILAQCDIAERRLPQDGRFTFTATNGLNRDCRLSSCPTIGGEKIVVRLLDAHKKLLTIEELGLTQRDQTILRHMLNQPQGLILVTGPTGSGKTITLYSALEYLNRKTHNIVTVEEPVEISLLGINQVNVHEKAGLTFSTVLKAFLRQDPDIIMVGEIRDKETAEISVRAAQTGHLVLSTLHTNSAADTVIRLMNMGIAPFNIADSLHLIIAQRLVRKRCSRCQQGCHYCTGGYCGREGVFEVMPISKTLSTLILQGNKSHIAQQAEQEGMQTLWQAALQKVQQGITSIEEIYRVISHE